MKRVENIAAVLFFALLNVCTSHAQTSFPNTKYPMVTQDLTFDDPINAYGRHVMTLDGAWGLGLNVTYLKPKVIYASVEAGYGWVIAAYNKYPQEDFKVKKWRPWVHARVGYPVFTFDRGVKAKFVTAYGSNDKGETVEYSYKVKVPTHTTFIPEIGYSINPHPVRMYQVSNSNYGPWLNMLAHTYNVGLRVRSLSKSKISLVDNDTKKTVRGSTYRMSEIYFGMVIPAKEFVKKPHDNYSNIMSTKNGYQLIFRMPLKHNGIGTFDIGVRAVGYSTEGRAGGEKAAPNFQLVIGNSIYGSSD